MKKYLLGLFSIFALSATASVFAKEIKMKVNGMTCDFCAQGIEKKFKKEAGVTGVKVDLGSKIVVVSLKEGSDISDDRLKTLITDSGYELAGIERSGK